MIDRGWVLPPLTKRVLEIVHCWSSYFELNVVPRRPAAVTVVEVDRLTIAGVEGIVVTSVTQIDSTNEGDIFVRCADVSNKNQLLVVTPATPHTLVKDVLPSGLVHH